MKTGLAGFYSLTHLVHAGGGGCLLGWPRPPCMTPMARGKGGPHVSCLLTAGKAGPCLLSGMAGHTGGGRVLAGRVLRHSRRTIECGHHV